jgi:ACS family hexuronate transporter-like MFS transporter
MTIDATVARSPEDDEPRRSPDPLNQPGPLHSPTPVPPFEGAPGRSKAWRYYICFLLLLATTINYVDRQALSVMKVRITSAEEMNLSNKQYGQLEFGFGLAFATGALFFGWVADRTNVFWLYPAVLALWSLMGYLTGIVESFAGLLVCRTLLGVFEAGHWPCALRTTQRLLPPGERTLGNSILQSGSSIGAALAPILIGMLLTERHGSWRFVFQAIGIIGSIWILLWFTALRPRELRLPAAQRNSQTRNSHPNDSLRDTADKTQTPFLEVVFSRRFFTLFLVVMAINACWHFFRAWLPMYLEEIAGFSEKNTRYIVTAFYVITDVGCIVAGYLTLRLARHGAPVHRARVLTFTGCALLTSLSLLIPSVPHGWPVVVILFSVGLGILGLFPCYYSFSQELSVTHQGKVTGLLGFFAWASVAPLHPVFGAYVDNHAGEATRFDPAFWFAGLCPLVAIAALWLLWSPAREARNA